MLKRFTTPQLAGIIAAFLAVLLIICGIIIYIVSQLPKPAPLPVATADSAAQIAARASADEPPARLPYHRTNLDKDTQPDPSSPAGNDGAVASAAANTPPAGSNATVPVRKTTDKTTPAVLSEALAGSGYSAETLDAYGTSQLIVVTSFGSSAEVSFYERTYDGWQQDDSLTCNGYVGSGGTTPNMSEGISATPQGLYTIGSAFYQGDAPYTGLPSFAITEDTYWIDDPDRDDYNTRHVGADGSGHGEAMAEIPSYQYGFVINYNTPPTGYARGSAIFFHISHDSPTLGCVAVDEDMVLAYLAKLDASLVPCILIL